MNKRILIVDDHQLVLDGLSSIVESAEGFDLASTAVNGEEALKYLEHLKIDILMTDLDMPVMNGQELTKKCKSKYPEIKILVLTMHDEKAMIKQLMELGADGYILKNSDRNELIRALETIASGKKFFSTDVTMALSKEDEKPEDLEALKDFTPREIEILKLVSEGLSNKEIGEKLFISHRTVDTHRTNIMKKLNVHNIAGLIHFSIRHGLLES